MKHQHGFRTQQQGKPQQQQRQQPQRQLFVAYCTFSMDGEIGLSDVEKFGSHDAAVSYVVDDINGFMEVADSGVTVSKADITSDRVRFYADNEADDFIEYTIQRI